MKFSKKVLSLLLVAVMLVSALGINVFALTLTFGEAKTGEVNIKVEVAKETGVIVDEMNGGSYDGSAGDLYAVTTYVQCDKALPYLYFPVNYNKDHFQLIAAILDNGDGTSSFYYGDETLNADMGGDTTLYMYGRPEYLQYTGNYNLNGVNVTAVMQQKVYGLGSTKATGYAEEVKSIDPDHSEYDNWGGEILGKSVGIVKLGFDAYTSKHAYLNTKIDGGIVTSTDYIQLVTLYFQRNAGVTEDDVIGDEFGAYNATAGIFDNFIDNNGAYYNKPSTATVDMTYTNAVVEGAPAPAYGVEYLKDQIRFKVDANNQYAGKFDFRSLANITGFDGMTSTEIEAIVAEAGFIYNRGLEANQEVTIDVDTAVAQIKNGTGSYSQVKNAYISMKDGKLTMACIVRGIEDADKDVYLATLGYIKLVDGTVYTFNEASSSTFVTLYNQYYSEAFKNA